MVQRNYTFPMSLLAALPVGFFTGAIAFDFIVCQKAVSAMARDLTHQKIPGREIAALSPQLLPSDAVCQGKMQGPSN